MLDTLKSAATAASLTLAALALPAAAQEAEIEEMALGAADAPVTVIEYASFTCPHCATFHDTVFEDLKRYYIDTGKVRFVTREVFFDRYGLWASMVARCGGEERYFGIVDTIYDRQGEWTAGEGPVEIVGNLRRIGSAAGLTDDQLDACLTDAAKAEALVEWYEGNAEADGIRSTQSFLIDGERHGNMPYADFADLIDEKLGS